MSLASLRQAVRGLRIRPSLTLAAITTIGLAVGTATAISPTDPLTLAGAVALLGAVGIGGGLLASRRALSVDPAIALREE